MRVGRHLTGMQGPFRTAMILFRQRARCAGGELAKGDGPDFVAMSGDFHYDFAREGNASFWMGGGPAVVVVDRPTGNNDTQLGVNVLTGVGKRTGDVRPFAQLRGTVAEDNRIALAGGIRF